MKARHLIAVVLMSFATVSLAGAEESTMYEDISQGYEEIRVALLNDTLDGVAENATAIRQRSDALAAEFDAAQAGVATDKAEEARALLPEISGAADRLASVGDLGEARAEYYELSKPMGRYRKLADIEGSMVVYCSMAKKAWIQPEGEIGNPYMGQSMPRCGEVIAD
jgi:hypothetical protein